MRSICSVIARQQRADQAQGHEPGEQARDLQLGVVLVERGDLLGGVMRRLRGHDSGPEQRDERDDGDDEATGGARRLDPG